MASHSRYRLLLVDTDSNYLARLFDLLSPYFEVCVLNDTTEALGKLDRYMPDMIVSEMDMPGMDGIKFANHVKKIPEHKNVPFVFLTNRDSKVDMRLGYMVKADRCLLKKGKDSAVVSELTNLLREKGLPVKHKPVSLEMLVMEQEEEARIKRHKALYPELEPEPEPEPPEPEMDGSEAWGESSEAPVVDYDEPLERPRLLLADKDVPQLACLHSLLGTFCDCVTTNCGIQVVEKATRYLPDILILNMRLNNLQGFEACLTLRTHPTFSKTPIIGILDAGDSLQASVIEAKYGASYVFEAPTEFGDLCMKVQNLMSNPAMRRASYPQTFEEVEMEEEAQLLESQKRKGKEEVIRRNQLLKNFLKEAVKE